MLGLLKSYRFVVRIIFFGSAFSIAACAMADVTRTDKLGLAQLSAEIDAGAFGDIAAIIVSQNGQIVFEDYFGRSGPDRLIDMRSVGKSITGLAAGVAIDEGMIRDVNTPVMSYFPQYHPKDSDKADITLKDLLMMRSALDCGDWADSPGNEERMYRTRDWTAFALNLPRDPAFMRGPDGTGRFRYCTAGAFLVGRVIARQSGIGLDQFVAQHIFEPIGIDANAVRWRRAPSGAVQGGGQIRLRARDVHRIGILVLYNGVWNGHQVVPQAWLTEMLTPRPVANADFSYGYLWWRKDLRIGQTSQRVPALMMIGNGGNIVAVIPARAAVIVIQARNYSALDHFETSQAMIVSYILPALASFAKNMP